MFVSAEELFANVKSMLKTYDAAGYLNDSDLFRWTRDCIDKFGTYSFKQHSILLEVENFRVNKPHDFKLIKDIYLCSLECEGKPVSTFKAYYNSPKIYTVTDSTSSLCIDTCNVCYDEGITYVKRIVSREFETEEKVHLKNLTPLSVNKKLSKEQCYKKSENLISKCKYSFDTTPKDFIFNFEKGHVNLQYFGIAVDEDGYPELMDDVKTLQAVEDYLIYKSLQQIWLNSEADVLNKMQYFELKYRQSLSEAILHTKLDTFRDLVEYSKKRKQYSNIFNIPSNSDARI